MTDQLDQISRYETSDAETTPLSVAQLGVWYSQQVAPHVPLNVAQYIEGQNLDTDLVERALEIACGEIDSMRMRVVLTDGEPRQTTAPWYSVPLEIIDLSTEADPEAAAHAWMRADYRKPLDLLRDSLVRIAVLRTTDTRFFTYMRAHHIAMDGYGATQVANRVFELYTALWNGSEIPAKSWATVQDAYALDTKYRNSPRYENDRKYWLDRVAGVIEPTSLSRTTGEPGAATVVASATYSGERLANIDAAVSRTGSTRAGIVIGAFTAYLSRVLDRPDVNLTLPVAARTTAVARRSGGMFATVLPLCSTIERDTTVSSLLSSVATDVFSLLRHQQFRQEDILRELGHQVGGPRVNVMLFDRDLQFGPERATLTILTSGAIDDIAVNLYHSEGGERVHLDLEANPNLYSPAEIEQHHRRFLEFLDRFAAANPETPLVDIEILGAGERDDLLEGFTDTAAPVPATTLTDLLNESFREHAHRTALIVDGQEFTYAQLAGRVNRLARKLIDDGVGPESVVVVAIRRSLDLVVAMNAVLQAGGVYVPIDPDHPADRNQHILDSARPDVVLTSTDAAQYSDGPIATTERLGVVRPDNTAYIIYTSGSTGKPKGVSVSHAAIVNQQLWMIDKYAIDASDVYLQKTASTFDVSMWGYFLPLMVGARIVLAPPGGHRDAAYLTEALTSHDVTLTDFVPSMLSVFVSHLTPGTQSSLRHVFVIGEALPVETASRFRRSLSAELDNLYGPTEAAVSITEWRCTPRDVGSVPIGTPAWNSGVLVLNTHLEPTPFGAVGELYLTGAQLARGYYGRGDLTAERFIANPYGPAGTRMYRTGDLVRWQLRTAAHGGLEPTLDYLGRTDFQVKLRGQRIELGEIEAVLLADDAVTQAAVAVVDGEHVVAYVIGERPDVDRLTASSRIALPSYMVPDAIVVLDEFPLNSSGKLDRKALPVPNFAAPVAAFVEPRTPTEELLAEIFRDILGVARIGARDDFFAMGGNSLNGTQVISRASQATRRELMIRDLFEAPSVEALATRIDARPASDEVRPPVAPASRDAVIPLSPAQRRLWFLNQMEPESAAYNMPFAARVHGRLELRVLEVAARDLLERHEALRTMYPDSATGPYQKIHRAEEIRLDVDVVETDIAGADEGLREMSLTGFDVTREPMLRIRLFQLAPEEFRFVLVLHHISGDGWSVAVLAADILHAYASRVAGKKPSWTPLPVQYADFSVWQNQLIGGWRTPTPLGARQLTFWKKTLADLPAELELPTDRPRPARRLGEGDQVRFTLDAELYSGLDSLARANNSTMFMALHSALAVLFARVTGTSDIPIGTPVAGRGDRALDPLIGMFVNTLVLRANVNPDLSFTELLDDVKAADLAAFANSDVPLETVVDAVQPVRSSSHQPLFQVMFAFQNVADVILEFDGLTIEPDPVPLSVIKFDMDISISKKTDDRGRTCLEASFGYATDIFDRETILSLADAYRRILEAVVIDSDVNVSSIDLVDGSTLPAPVVVPQCVMPDLLRGGAIVSGDRTLDFAQIDAWSSRLARELIAYGAGPEDFIAVAMTRSIESVIAMWAVAKTGAGFVPINPEYPLERISFILSDTRARIGLTTSNLRRSLPDSTAWLIADDPETAVRRSSAPIAQSDRRRPLRLDDVAYLIYTSGSTGTPKAVAVTHRGLEQLAAEVVKTLRISSSSRVLHAHSPSFDAAMLDLLGTFSVGATLVVNPPEVIGGSEMARILVDNRITHYLSTPAILATLEPENLPDLETAVVGGDACPPALVSRWAPYVNLVNSYGPTETTVITAQVGNMVADRPVTLGPPLHGVQVMLLDQRLRPVPAGTRGEVYIAGQGVARGYHNRPDLTGLRFIPNPYGAPGDRMYRTGDLASMDPNGELLYYGRTDRQMKIRGQRIEPGEIETFLTKQPSVAQAIVLPYTDATTGTHLVAYVKPKHFDRDSLAAVKAATKKSLPRAMVPEAFVEVREFPITPNGKLDIASLPQPLFSATTEFVAPETDVEMGISAVFSDVLGLDRVGLDDDFFALGGTSLLTLTLREELSAQAGVQISTRAVFEAPTVRGLARLHASTAGLTSATEQMQLDAQLDPAIQADSLPVASGTRNVLLTGATGFLGTYLLRELLDGRADTVWCLVRASDEDAARRRLRDRMLANGLWCDDAARRIKVVVGDLAAPNLGLSVTTFEQLAATVEVVVHNGAQVNHIAPYASLRGANVLGTIELLRLATTSTVKAVHYVSTAATVMHAGADEVGESTRLAAEDVVESGYAESKWVAEQLMLSAARRGIPTAIYRPTLISGDIDTGVSNPVDGFWNMIRAAAELGASPHLPDAMVSMVPVGHAAAVIAELAFAPAYVSGRAYHVVNHQAVAVERVLAALRRKGYVIEEQSSDVRLDERLRAVASERMSRGDNSLARAALLMDAEMNASAVSAALLDENTSTALGGRLVCPKITDEILDRYVRYLLAVGFLPRPQVRADAAG